MTPRQRSHDSVLGVGEEVPRCRQELCGVALVSATGRMRIHYDVRACVSVRNFVFASVFSVPLPGVCCRSVPARTGRFRIAKRHAGVLPPETPEALPPRPSGFGRPRRAEATVTAFGKISALQFSFLFLAEGGTARTVTECGFRSIVTHICLLLVETTAGRVIPRQIQQRLPQMLRPAQLRPHAQHAQR